MVIIFHLRIVTNPRAVTSVTWTDNKGLWTKTDEETHTDINISYDILHNFYQLINLISKKN